MGTLQNFQNMRRRGSHPARAHQRVIIGPWTHTDFSGSFPDREFGPAASATAIDLSGIQLRWFDRWLRGTDNGMTPNRQ
jgi:predicted acyl esterase